MLAPLLTCSRYCADAREPTERATEQAGYQVASVCPVVAARQRPRLTWTARPAWAWSIRCRYMVVRFIPLELISSAMLAPAFLKEAVGAEDIPLVEAGGLPAAAVAGFVGYGTPAINAFHVGSRLILNNGHHRIYTLRKLGVTTIPILILEVANPLPELPPAIAGVPRELCLAPRPPLVKDLLDEDFGITLSVKRRLKQLTIMMNLNQYEVPA